ncbi:signal recognition particle-docking protein FtsY [Marinicella sp. S1101]|uniref:signal recognition particle-docking protein FtsY n=1 Tax=Marinicella marina TaxID=2996016 RepID=UPI002260EEA0|nr:signal recognition particle-docking protein FtsY [Marinicella marina]MCX7553028.1 signal recognition particle-docking protein FtsY [Marinicella marina]MDJ1139662.1 signal recognition particle-docking protein FtsY [Marinicella marina]
MINFFKKKNKNKTDKDKLKTDAVTEQVTSDADADAAASKPASQPAHDAGVMNQEIPIDAVDPKQTTPAAEPAEVEIVVPPELLAQGVEPHQYQLSQQLSKTNDNFGKKMKQMLSLKKQIDEDLFEELETTLLMADVGATATMEVIEKVRKSLKRRNLSDSDAVFDALKAQLTELAQVVEQPLIIDESKQPFVILVVGVNGVGKTTTIAKLARKYKSMGKKVMLAAGDTFRAAAVEQLKTWGEREDIPVMAQKTGADSASVIFDAMTSAKAHNMDVLIADTAGRLHTQANLMQELEKISRVIQKNDDTAPHETLIVIDGGTGQNAISQVREFNKANALSGVVITKLDGTPKGGVLFNLAAEFGIPVRFIGVGEKSTDLKSYKAAEFVDAIID